MHECNCKVAPTVSKKFLSDRRLAAPGWRPVKVFQSVFFTGVLIFRIASTDQRIYNVNNQKNLERIFIAAT